MNDLQEERCAYRMKELQDKKQEQSLSKGEMLELGVLYAYCDTLPFSAEELLEEVLRLQPDNVEALCWTIVVNKSSGYAATRLNELQAITDLILSLSLTSERRAAGWYLKYSLMCLSRDAETERKIECLEKSVSEGPHWVSNRDALGIELEHNGRPEESIEQWERAIENVIDTDPGWELTKLAWERMITLRDCSQVYRGLIQERLKRVREVLGFL